MIGVAASGVVRSGTGEARDKRGEAIRNRKIRRDMGWGRVENILWMRKDTGSTVDESFYMFWRWPWVL